ncbi:hypothetical protein GQ602_005569 [Ophiocordyceps camponoti-floridani]|uniref:DNA mismatch repair protein HSM3 N-terminal domain-containing protein n=1 Tax=Ophiocordyceps camponoti-floridani TaxID=2030778 RepID=A0A8H4Q3K2_9HYPO|nr:hypothetical protein GQ602_005569 [Ophiocordyceps camponoti-floridani]
MDHVVVPIRPSTSPISGLSELQAHLEALTRDNTLAPDAKLLDEVELQLTGKQPITNSRQQDNYVLTTTSPQPKTSPPPPNSPPPLANLLKTTAQDTTPLLTLAIKLISPLSLSESLTFADGPSLLAALRSPLRGANLLALAIVGKAASSADEAARLADMPGLVEELLRCWLESADVGVGESAAGVLGGVLEVDCPIVETVVNGTRNHLDTGIRHDRPPGRGRIWPLILASQANLTRIHNSCSLNNPSRSTHDITISQGRLLSLLPRLSALDLDRLTAPSIFHDVSGRGILQWAALSMVDRSDTLMHLSLINFYESLVVAMLGRPHGLDDALRGVFRHAVGNDAVLEYALRSLPDRSEGGREELRRYVDELLS